MRTKVNFAVVASVLVLGSAGVQAADLTQASAPDEAFNWSGFYVGVHGGYGHGKSEYSYSERHEYWDDNYDNVFVPSDPGYRTDPDAIVLYDGQTGTGGHVYEDLSYVQSGKAKFDLDGAFGGAQIGYNYQYSSFVIGAVADISIADIESGRGNFTTADGGDFSVSSKVDWFGTIRGRAGVAWDKVLLFGTGGLAYGRVKSSYDYSVNGDDYSGSNAETKLGWTAGGGIEYALTSNITLSTEYLYVDLGKSDVTDGAQQVGYEDHYTGGNWSGYTADYLSVSGKTQLHTVRAGLNYKF